jgi:hypothetical protein
MSEGQRLHIKCAFRDEDVPGERGKNALHRRLSGAALVLTPILRCLREAVTDPSESSG